MADGSVSEVWSFFSGAMGLDLGLEQGGIVPTLANEIDPKCRETIQLNRPNLQLIQEGIEDLHADRVREARGFHGDVDLMVGGPPCQSFSSGGKRLSLTDPRGNLMYEYLRLIGEVRPRYFVLENVANITTAALRHRPIAERPGQHWSLKHYDNPMHIGRGDAPRLQPDEKSGSAIRKLLEDVQRLEYKIVFGVLDAADYGAPQHRLRFIMMGARDGVPPPLPSPTYGMDGSGLLPFRTVRDAIARYRCKPGPGSRYTETVASYFTLVPPGGNWRDLPQDLQPSALGGSWAAGGGKTGFYRRLPWDAPSPTIIGRANRKGSALCHPEAVRPISVREAAALQGFPDDWQFAGSSNAQYLQIGNAVPIALGTALAKSIHQAEQLDHRAGDIGFDAMLDHAVARLRASARNKRRPKP